MKRQILSAVATAAMLLGASQADVLAEVTAEYSPAVRVGGRPYTPLSNRVIIPASDFRLPPSNVTDRDDGYVRENLGFTFAYNNQLYNSVWINVNGFVMFSNSQPPNIPADNPAALFQTSASVPNNVVAPFWGDHYYRVGGALEPGYLASEISVERRGSIPGSRVFIVEWRNLNINNENIASSVGNFQLYIYEASQEQINLGNYQGNIEFAYGQIGGNGPTVITQGASVGIKGETSGDQFNALPRTNNPNVARTSAQRTNEWQPSGGSDTVFRFAVIQRIRLSDWGDGDANLSHAQFGQHAGLPQNRFVTMSDVRLILSSLASNIPLDSIRERQAYHGDVNHTGRYYYSTRNMANTADTARHKRLVQTRSITEFDDLPSDNSLPFIAGQPSFFFEVNEYDAAIIMAYMSGRVPSLPWLLDTIVPHGKVGMNAIANNINFGTVEGSNGEYTIPVYLNGNFNGPVSARFDMNGTVTGVTINSTLSAFITADYANGTVIIAGAGAFSQSEPIAYVTVQAVTKDIQVSNIRFNENSKPAVSFSTSRMDEAVSGDNALAQNDPNPVVAFTTITGTVPADGIYSLAIYDLMGNKVKTIADRFDAASGKSFSYSWDTSNDAGAAVAAGTYIYRLEGEGMVVSKKLIVAR